MKKIYTINAGAKPKVQTGQILSTHLTSKKIAQSVLARKMERTNSTIGQYLSGITLQTAILVEISHALKHNFFTDIAAMLPQDYTSNVQPDTSKDERIAALEREVEIVKAEKQVLLEAMRK